METTEEQTSATPNLLTQAKALGATGLSALQNRAELLILELEEERSRALELIVWALAAGFLAFMVLAMVTVLVILLCPPEQRPWAVGGFCALYLVGAVLALLNLKSLLHSGPPPFAGTINEMKKDREWLDSLK